MSPTSSIRICSLQLMNLQEHIIITQSPQFTLGFTLCVVHSMGLNKCIMLYIHCHTHRQQFNCTSHPIFTLTPGYHWSLYCFYSCAFSRIIQLESYNIQPFQIDFLHLVISSKSFHGLTAHFLLAWGNILLSGCTKFIYPFIYRRISWLHQVWLNVNKTAINIHLQNFVWT